MIFLVFIKIVYAYEKINLYLKLRSFNMGIRMPGFVAALRTVPDKQKKI